MLRITVCSSSWWWCLPRECCPIIMQPVFGIVMQQVRRISQSNILYSDHLTLKSSYALLGVSKDTDLGDVKASFISLAKIYHPDSGANTADAEKFTKIKNAYKIIEDYLRKKEEAVKIEEADTEKGKLEFDIKHTAPQHRRYLDFEGIGYGTPSQRRKQYEKYKVRRASENVMDYRTEKIMWKVEDALLVKDKRQARKAKIRNTMDRLVEDLILDSMAKGEFQNLEGKGKPLAQNYHNPFVDTTTHNLNKIMIENGYAPEWITLEKEFRNDLKIAKVKLERERYKLGPLPFSSDEEAKWIDVCKHFEEDLKYVNEKVDKFNMIVPTLRQQIMPFCAKNVLTSVLNDYETISLKLAEEIKNTCDVLGSHPGKDEKFVTFADVMREIAALFRRGVSS